MCVRLNTGEIPNISIINMSSKDLDIKKIAKSINHQIKSHVQPSWGVKSNITDKDMVNSWKLYIKDNLDIIGVEGYHSINKNMPFSMVKANDDINQTTLTVSHEIIEMLVNPALNLIYKSDSNLYLNEICDPSCKDFYFIKGIAVSNFVYPSWFDKNTTALRFDHMNIIKKPLQISKGGYASILVSNQWKSIFN